MRRPSMKFLVSARRTTPESCKIVTASLLLVATTLWSGSCPAQGGLRWQQLTPTTSPPAHQNHSMATDVARGQIVLFGGRPAPGGPELAQTWTWNGSNWSLRAPSTAPPARSVTAMVDDYARGRVVMFGGSVAGIGASNDTWEWDGVNWTQVVITSTSVPGPRWGHAMAYDAARGQVVLFGGTDGTNSFSGTWVYNGTARTWTRIAVVPPSPGPREFAGMAYDAARQRVVLFGGRQGATLRLGDTWEWDGSNWTQASPVTRPSPRNGGAMTFDAGRARTLLFGGNDGVRQGDAWEWDGVNWTQRTPTVGPTARSGVPDVLVHNPATGRSLLFGGYTGAATMADTWALSSVSPASFTVFGAPGGVNCAGGLGNLTLDPSDYSLPWLGDTFCVELGNLPPGSLAFMALGFSSTTSPGGPLPRNLTALGLSGCWQLSSAEGAVALTVNGGTATWSQMVLNNPALVGWPLFLQGAALSAGGNNALGAALSNGGQATIGMR